MALCDSASGAAIGEVERVTESMIGVENVEKASANHERGASTKWREWATRNSSREDENDEIDILRAFA